MAHDSERQAGALSQNVEITPQMIEAGLASLSWHLGGELLDRCPYEARLVAAEILKSALSVSSASMS